MPVPVPTAPAKTETGRKKRRNRGKKRAKKADVGDGNGPVQTHDNEDVHEAQAGTGGAGDVPSENRQAQDGPENNGGAHSTDDNVALISESLGQATLGGESAENDGQDEGRIKVGSTGDHQPRVEQRRPEEQNGRGHHRLSNQEKLVLRPFDAAEPSSWFEYAERQFELHYGQGVDTREYSKAECVFEALPVGTEAHRVADRFLSDNRYMVRYKELKMELMAPLMTPSIRAKKLFAMYGRQTNPCPETFWAQIKDLATLPPANPEQGGEQGSVDLLREIFLSGFSESVRSGIDDPYGIPMDLLVRRVYHSLQKNTKHRPSRS